MKIFVKYFLFLVSILTCCNCNFCRCSCCKDDQQGDVVDKKIQNQKKEAMLLEQEPATTPVKRYGFIIDLVNGVYKKTDDFVDGDNCLVCQEGAENIDRFVSFSCGDHATHFLCLECFFNGFYCNISSTGLITFPCPFCNCGIPKEKLLRLFLDVDIFNNIDNQYLADIKHFFSIKRQESSVEVVYDLNAEKELYKSFNSPYKDDEKKRILFKPCPFCRAMIQKEYGCNSVKCSLCQCSFCWLCGWFSFGLRDDAHEHINSRDCVIKGELFQGFNEDKATYFGHGYLFGNDEYQKPRCFFYYLCEIYKDRITTDKYIIEDSITNNSPDYTLHYPFQKKKGTDNQYTIIK